MTCHCYIKAVAEFITVNLHSGLGLFLSALKMSGSSVLPSSVKLPIDGKILDDLIVKTKDYAIMNGGEHW